MTDERSDDGMAEDREQSPRKTAALWLTWVLVLAVVFGVGLFGGLMVNSFRVSIFGEEQEPGLDNAGNVERRADRMAGEGPVPLATETPPAVQDVAQVTETVETVETVDTRQKERRTLAYESPLTPPVADVASRIRKREEERQAATGAARADGPFDTPVATSAPGGSPAGTGFPVGPGPSNGVLANASPGLGPGGPSPQAQPVAADTPDGGSAHTGGSAVRHELYRGSVIPAVLESAIDSDLPGLVRARTTRNVYDSRTGTHLLIPRGSRLIGVYGQNVGSGAGTGGNRRRLFVAWQEMRLPDGTPVALDNFSALGADGASGIKARRATGFLEALGAAVLFDLAGNATAILTAATGIGQQQSETGALANAISGALGNSTQRVGADYVGSLLAQGPRFRVKAGSFMNVIIERDLMLPAVGRTKATR